MHSSFDTGGSSSALATSLRYRVVDLSWSGMKSSDWVLPASVCSLSPCSVVAPGIHFWAPLSFLLHWVIDGGICIPPPTRLNLMSTFEPWPSPWINRSAIIYITFPLLDYPVKGNGNIFFVFSFVRTFKTIYDTLLPL